MQDPRFTQEIPAPPGPEAAAWSGYSDGAVAAALPTAPPRRGPGLAIAALVGWTGFAVTGYGFWLTRQTLSDQADARGTALVEAELASAREVEARMRAERALELSKVESTRRLAELEAQVVGLKAALARGDGVAPAAPAAAAPAAAKPVKRAAERRPLSDDPLAGLPTGPRRK